MQILVIQSRPGSVALHLVNPLTGRRVFSAQVDDLGALLPTLDLSEVQAVAHQLSPLGEGFERSAPLDAALMAKLDESQRAVVRITQEALPGCPQVAVFDVPLHLAQAAAALLPKTAAPTLPIAVSARHIHLTEAAVRALFGPHHTLTPYKPLSQPGQFACEEQLTIIGPKRSIEGVRVLGPVRSKCQVEISRTDEFHLGVDAPVRGSGDVANTPSVTLEGPAGRLTLDEGLICAWRHIHMTPEDAQRFGVQNKDVVDVTVDTDGRDLTFGDVLVRVSPKYALEMHIDTDEANAAELSRGTVGSLVPTESTARLTLKA